MITLGLDHIVPKRSKRSHQGLWTVAEAVERLEPSSEVVQALCETVVWCCKGSLHHFRSDALDPSIFPKVPPFGESGMDAWLERKRESFELAVSAVNANRRAALRAANVSLANPAVLEAKGRLLLYDPLETVVDGASESCSRGFFDIEDAPPWDLWFLYSAGSIISWVPETIIQTVQAGIDANPVDCIRWCAWTKIESVEKVSGTGICSL